jgi:hypothetical protein
VHVIYQKPNVRNDLICRVMRAAETDRDGCPLGMRVAEADIAVIKP